MQGGGGGDEIDRLRISLGNSCLLLGEGVSPQIMFVCCHTAAVSCRLHGAAHAAPVSARLFPVNKRDVEDDLPSPVGVHALKATNECIHACVCVFVCLYCCVIESRHHQRSLSPSVLRTSKSFSFVGTLKPNLCARGSIVQGVSTTLKRIRLMDENKERMGSLAPTSTGGDISMFDLQCRREETVRLETKSRYSSRDVCIVGGAGLQAASWSSPTGCVGRGPNMYYNLFSSRVRTVPLFPDAPAAALVIGACSAVTMTSSR